MAVVNLRSTIDEVVIPWKRVMAHFAEACRAYNVLPRLPN
jgi:hypothetical protein